MHIYTHTEFNSARPSCFISILIITYIHDTYMLKQRTATTADTHNPCCDCSHVSSIGRTFSPLFLACSWLIWVLDSFLKTVCTCTCLFYFPRSGRIYLFYVCCCTVWTHLYILHTANMSHAYMYTNTHTVMLARCWPWCTFSEGPRLRKMNPPRIERIEHTHTVLLLQTKNL